LGRSPAEESGTSLAPKKVTFDEDSRPLEPFMAINPVVTELLARLKSPKHLVEHSKTLERRCYPLVEEAKALVEVPKTLGMILQTGLTLELGK